MLNPQILFFVERVEKLEWRAKEFEQFAANVE
jgi:hypothetical protein